MLLLIFVFLSSQLQKMSEIYPTPIPFSLMLRFGPQLAFFFSLVALPEAALQGSPRPLFPSPRLSQLTPVLLPTVSTAKCDAFNFFGFCIVFARFVFEFLPSY